MKYYVNETYTKPDGQKIIHRQPYPTFAEAQIEFEQTLVDIKEAHKNVDVDRSVDDIAIIKFKKEDGEEIEYTVSVTKVDPKDAYFIPQD